MLRACLLPSDSKSKVPTKALLHRALNLASKPKHKAYGNKSKMAGVQHEHHNSGVRCYHPNQLLQQQQHRNRLQIQKNENKKKNENKTRWKIHRRHQSKRTASFPGAISEGEKTVEEGAVKLMESLDNDDECCSIRHEDRAWSARRRDRRVNGADLYVARITKTGTGVAEPCWRCLEWARWAGIRRIFHWEVDGKDPQGLAGGKWRAIKVNQARADAHNGLGDRYQTHADLRLYSVSLSC